MEPRKPYSTDLTDREWALIEPYVPRAKRGGRPEQYPKREILNGIFYIVRGGCAWRLLPHDFPPWQIVYHYFWIWRQDGSWQRMHDCSAAMCGWPRANIANPAQGSSTANR
jgi:putative transposase